MTRFLLPALAAFAAFPAAAQTIAATTLDLTNDGAFDPDVDCAYAADGAVVWFDGGTESLYVYNDEDPDVDAVQEIVPAADIDAAAGVDADRCRAMAYDPDTDVFYLALATADNLDFVLSIGGYDGADLIAETITSPTDGAADGITGLTVVDDKLYLAVQDFLNDPPSGGAPALENGLYSVELTGENQTPAAVVTLTDLSLSALSASPSGTTLYAASNRFGSGDYQNVLVAFDLSADPVGVSIFADPFDGASFTVPTNESRFDLDALVVAADDENEAVFVLNNNFDATDGEEIARFSLDGAGELFASQATILTDLDRATGGFTPGGGPNTLLYDSVEGRLLVLNSSQFGGVDEVLVVAGDDFATGDEDAPVLATLTVGPNPFAGTLGVALSVDRAQTVSVAVYDVLGRRVASLYDGPLAGGQRLDLRLEGSSLPSGTYLVRVQTEAGLATRTVTLAR